MLIPWLFANAAIYHEKYSVGCFCLISVGSYCSLGCLFNSHTSLSYVAGLASAFSGCSAENLEAEGLKIHPFCW